MSNSLSPKHRNFIIWFEMYSLEISESFIDEETEVQVGKWDIQILVTL